jgi:hypothetical protein
MKELCVLFPQQFDEFINSFVEVSQRLNFPFKQLGG